MVSKWNFTPLTDEQERQKMTNNDETMNGTARKIAMAAAATLLAGTGAWAQAPVIGIAATPSESSQKVGNDYVTAVTRAGGIPLLIPATDDPLLIEATLDQVDGVLLTGGVDVDPAYYGEERHPMLGEVNAERDTFEMLLIDKVVERLGTKFPEALVVHRPDMVEFLDVDDPAF